MNKQKPKELKPLDKADAERIIGQTLVRAELDTEDWGCNEAVILTFSNGAKLRAGIGCGETSQDFPYFSFYVE